MVDIVTAAKRSEMMAGIKGKNTKPEIIVRKALHAAGFRFRLHSKRLPGKPDIVLPKWRTVVFVNGCFWHGHENCKIFRLPKSRRDFWTNKISANIDRDTDAARMLENGGWKVVKVWECAMKGRGKLPADKLGKALVNSVLQGEGPVEIRGDIA